MSSNSNNTMSSNSDNTQRPLTDLEASFLARVDAHLRLLSMEPPQTSPMAPRQQPAAPRPADEYYQQAPNQQHHRQQSSNPDNQQPRASDLSTATPQTRLILVDEELFEVLYQHALEGIYTPEDMAIWQQIQELADNSYGPEINTSYNGPDHDDLNQLADNTYGPEINTSYNGPDHDYLNQRAAAYYLQNEERYREIQQFWIDQHEIVDEDEYEYEDEDDYGYFSA